MVCITWKRSYRMGSIKIKNFEDILKDLTNFIDYIVDFSMEESDLIFIEKIEKELYEYEIKILIDFFKKI